MCMSVFVGLDRPLPIVSSHQDCPALPIVALPPEYEGVRRLFSKPHIYDVCSLFGCACGFSYDVTELDIVHDPNAPDEAKDAARNGYQVSRNSIAALQDLLRLAAVDGTAEVYSCWERDWNEEPETHLQVGFAHFGGDTFQFVERQFLVVSAATPLIERGTMS